jgi:response regulator RpfG family c-di-GMP phosphodiesterase
VAQSLLLRCFGYGVLEAGNQGEAWFASHQYKGPIHLVLTKAILENKSTSEFVARLQLIYPQMRALFVCDESPSEMADMPCEYAFLQRPFRVETLAYTIRGLLQGSKERAAASLS